MGTSVYFQNYSPTTISEQRLLEDIIVESVQIMGHNVQYLPREVYDSTDVVYGESVRSKFERAYTMEMYLANVEGYEGDGDFFSKFGLEIRDTSNFVVPKRTFDKYVPSTVATRPREGDLVYVPVLQKIFEIKFVEEELLFFSLGKSNPYIYELRCEVFRYNQEDFNTGMQDVDNTADTVAYTIELTMGAGSGNYSIGETVYQGASLAAANISAKVMDWDSSTKKLKVINIKGIFSNGTQVVGNTSGISYYLTSSDTLGDFALYDSYENKQIQDEADTFIDLSETNPFGMP